MTVGPKRPETSMPRSALVRTVLVRSGGTAAAAAAVGAAVLYQSEFPIHYAPNVALCAAFGIPLAAGLLLRSWGVAAVAVGSALALLLVARLEDGWIAVVGAVAEAAFAAVYVRRVDLGRGLGQTREVARLAFACLIGAAVRGTVTGLAAAALGNSQWFELGLACAVLGWLANSTLVPVVLAWSIPKAVRPHTRRRLVEGSVTLAVLAAAVLILALRSSRAEATPPLVIAALVGLIAWVVYRYEVRGTSAGIALTAAIVGAEYLWGPSSQPEDVFLTRGQSLFPAMAAVNFLLLALAAMARERRIETETNVRLLDELFRQRDATDLAVADLRRERAFLETVLDQLPSGIVIIDPYGKVTFKNQVHKDCFGAMLHEGSSVRDFRNWHVLRPDGTPLPYDERPVILTLADHRPHEEAELRYFLADGNVATVSSHSVPIRGPGGEFLGVVAVIHDLTERKRADQKFRLTDERLRTALHSAGMIAWDWDLQSGSVWRSEPLEIWLDMPHDPSVSRGTMHTPLIHPDDVAKVDAQMAEVAAGREELDSTYRIRRSDGVYVWVNSRGKAIVDDEGRPAGRMAGVLIDITDRKKQEQRLRLLESAVVHARDAVVILEAQSQSRPGRSVLYVNEAFTRLTGYDAKEVVGRSLHFLRGPRSDAGALDRLKDALNAATPLLVELLNYRKDGTELWVEISLVPVPDASGRLTHWVMIQRDISDRKRAEEQLLASQARLAEAQRIAELGYWEWDLGSDAAVWSEETFRLLGYEPGELEPRPGQFFDTVHPDDIARVRAFHGEAGSSDVPYEYDCRILRTDGIVRHMHVEGHYAYKPDGTPFRLSGILRDVTTQTEAAEALRRGEERYRLLFDANPHPMWVFDEDSLRFLAVNDAAVRKYEFTRDEFLGMSITEIRPPSEIPKILGHLATENHGASYGAPKLWRHRTKSGIDLDVEISSYRFLFDGRNSQLILASDVTERRRLEDQLRQAQKMDAVGQMAGGIAHDFNNLLTGIVGNLALVALPPDDPNWPLLNTAERAAHRAADLTRKLLGFARKNQLLVAPVRVRDLAQEVVDLLRRTLDPRIEIVTDLGPPISILADATLINQVLLNLCLNARDAMPNGGQLTIAAAADEGAPRSANARPGPYVCLSVSDTGAGMPLEVQARAFEPFFTTKPVGQGTGLGLAMVHGIVQQHGGWLTLDSTPGAGTRFELYLPQVENSNRPHGSGAMPRAATLRTAPPDTAPPPPMAGPPRTVLLVDDEDMIRTIARSVLESDGFVVIEAADGLEAVEVFRRESSRIDLVILDLTMPRLSGRDAFRTIAEIDPDACVLFSSGYSSDDLSDVSGAVGLLAKPYRPYDLLLAVRLALVGRPAAVAVP